MSDRPGGSLHDLQRQFAVGLSASAPVPSAGLLRPLAGQGPRWAVYRHAYRSRLIGALRSNYPVLHLSLGDDAFDALALDYLAHQPSTQPSIRWFGHLLAQHMARLDETLVPHPALIDLARMEWALGSSFDSPDARPLALSDLAGTAPKAWPALRFVAHPALRLLDLAWAVEPVWHQLSDDPQASTGEPEALHHSLLVWRPQLATRWRSLDAGEAQLLRLCLDGADVAALCAEAAQQVAQADAPTHALGLLQRWVQDGLLCATAPAAPQDGAR
jgi:hypothetical protein